MRPILCFVLDRSATKRPLLEVVDFAVRNGVDWIQIRDRSLETRALFDHASEVSACARAAAEAVGRPVRILVNGRVDVALSVGADGVHLGGDALRPADARQLLGAHSPIGVSTHAPDEIARAAKERCDYAHLAPIFDPLSKAAERPALGLSALESASRHGIPVLAQGGVRAEHCRRILAAGAAGVAVTGDISMSEDPGSAAAVLRAALDR